MAKMHRSTLILACLALTGPAVALAGTDALPPQASSTDTTATAGDMKVGIDKSGHLRPLTAEEQQQLNTQQTAKRSAVKTGKSAVAGRSLLSQPRSEQEAIATLKKAPNGMRSMAVPQELMSSMSATRGADGKIVISEGNNANNGRPSKEAVNE